MSKAPLYTLDSTLSTLNPGPGPQGAALGHPYGLKDRPMQGPRGWQCLLREVPLYLDPSTLDPGRRALRVDIQQARDCNMQWTGNPTPSTLNPKHPTPHLRPQTLHPKPSTLKPKPSTPNPQPQTLNHKPSTPTPQPSTLHPATLQA